MVLSKYGKIVADEIQKMPSYNRRCILDEWVVMPDHLHLLIELEDWDYNNGMSERDEVSGEDARKKNVIYYPRHRASAWWANPDYVPTEIEIKKYRRERRRMIIPKIVGKMKMLSSKQINLQRKLLGIKNWQADYHDFLIRDREEYKRIKNYIINNPSKWNEDKSREE